MSSGDGQTPNFHFTLADIFNKDDNPRGQLLASEYTFPYPEDAFDLVLLISVSTDMPPEDTHRCATTVCVPLAP